ncbi:MAG: lysophospholipid acyltransferase family protein [Planctomycetota bacterium]|jgi:lysophospholipid acyltransferase (LPLAT)-like uncharacterized protein
MSDERSFKDDVKIACAVGAAACLNSVSVGLTRTTRTGSFYAERRRGGEPGRCLYAVWHGHLWHLMRAFRNQDVFALVSRHRDGEIIARVLARQGIRLLRGSSTRGGAQAMRELVRAVREDQGDVVVTVDGPKGPAGEVKDGILFAASRTALPIVPVAMWADRGWRAGSWDRMVVAKPFARVAIVIGDEIRVPEDADRRSLGADHATEVARGLHAAEARARGLLGIGR